MDTKQAAAYKALNEGKHAFCAMPRGIFHVSGGEATKFLNGLVTNDVAKLENGDVMNAAFPTVKGRVFALTRVRKVGEGFYIETEEATRQKVYENLFRFTFAGDFQLEDLSDQYEFYRFFVGRNGFPEGSIGFANDVFVPLASAQDFREPLENGVEEIDTFVYEIARIERGIPVYGIDVDEDTVVPEIAIDDLISYQKGCYIGQEVIARIHFLGKPAKEFRKLSFASENEEEIFALLDSGETRIENAEGKDAGFVTSAVFSPKAGKVIGLGYIRSAYLDGTNGLRFTDIDLKISI